jgi:cyclohexadieny/prephenate dehydrogenase
VIPHLCILAPGLLGGSVGLAAHARGVAQRITVWARRPEVRIALENQPWCASVAATPEAAVREADLVVLAAPVDRIAELVAQIAPHVRSGAWITDVGSTKGALTRAAHAALAGRAHFVGAHPMAGSEKTGWENGHAAPTLDEMQRIRETASARRIKWSDKLFFEAPAQGEAA